MNSACLRSVATLFLLLPLGLNGQNGAGLAARAQAILQANCAACHGAARMGGLDLRERESLLKGGGRGPALIPGDAAASLLFRAVQREGELKMPPGKAGLKADEVEALRAWIDAGAGWAAAGEPRPESNWWAFRKPRRPALPAAATPGSNPIDTWIAAKLVEQGLHPLGPASRAALIRRAYFDLWGLPPSPAEVESFIADPAPDAYEKLIDRLLASPRYGERWGRHWLDVVRYADTGGFETDVHYKDAWRYRDYVIDSFNEDKPYTQFVQEQVAADEIWPVDLDLEGSYELPADKQQTLKRWFATGLYTIGPMAAEFTFYGDQYRAEWQAESAETTASAFLGLTFGCARCHDHKFDPITQRDYYRLSALFAGSEDAEVPIVSRMAWVEYARYLPRQLMVDELAKKVALLQNRVRERMKAQGTKAKKPSPDTLAAQFTPAERDEYESLLREIGRAYIQAPKRPDTARVLVHSGKVHPAYVLNRGDWQQHQEEAPPGFPAFLHAGPAIDEPSGDRFLPLRRKALAEWLTSPDNPLLARVMVNRVWQWHFGEGLVATPNDFGRQGEPPTHPELLDWLAVEFAGNGYRLKDLHRKIMLSQAYRRTSGPDEENHKIDPANRYLWRMNRQRLDAEQLRDSILAVSGALNLEMYGPPVAVPLTEEERSGMRDATQWAVAGDPAEFTRRSVYLYVKRSFRLPMLETFNAPDSSSSCARREASTVAPQALALMNSEFVREQSGRFAARLRAEAGDGPEAQVEAAWKLALGRAPSPEEKQKAVAFVSRASLPRLCLLLYNLSEFLYVD